MRSRQSRGTVEERLRCGQVAIVVQSRRGRDTPTVRSRYACCASRYARGAVRFVCGAVEVRSWCSRGTLVVRSRCASGTLTLVVPVRCGT